MTRWNVVLLKVGLSFVAWSMPSRADVAFPGVQFVCTPDINYFSATTINLDNVDVRQLQRSAVLTIMDLADLKAHPYVCRWGENVIRANLTYFHEAQPRGTCGGVEYGNVELDWNNVPIAKIEEDACRSGRHTVTVTDLHYRGPASIDPVPVSAKAAPDLFIEHCSSTEDHNGTFNCEIHYFDLGGAH